MRREERGRVKEKKSIGEEETCSFSQLLPTYTYTR
jgi:hypothetical protein